MAIKNHRREVSRALRSEINQRLEQSGITITNNVKKRAPVDTGLLRASYGHTVDSEQSTVIVGTRIKYSVYQEFGTRYQSGTPHLRPGTNDSRPALVALWSKPIEG